MAIAPIEIKRMELELLKVAAARAELEFRVEEFLDQIAQVKAHIKIQLDKEDELKKRIEKAKAEAPAGKPELTR
jgi:hypothetical protein